MRERAGGPRRVSAGFVPWVGALLSLSFADSAAAAPPAPRLSVEEVLRQAARVTWTDDAGGGATLHRVQRRARSAGGGWSDWIDVASGSDPNQIIDAGAD